MPVPSGRNAALSLAAGRKVNASTGGVGDSPADSEEGLSQCKRCLGLRLSLSEFQVSPKLIGGASA